MQTVTLLIIKTRGTYSYRSALKGRVCTVRSRRIAYILKALCLSRKICYNYKDNLYFIYLLSQVFIRLQYVIYHHLII
jgi:hypothetical protein